MISGTITEQDHFSHIDAIWEKYVKMKYPKMPKGEEYMRLRHTFFVGVWTMMGIAQKLTPGPKSDHMIRDIMHEVRAELHPDEAKPTGN